MSDKPKTCKMRVYARDKPERLMISIDPPHTNVERDIRWISSVFSPEFMRELAKRSYDPLTMEFSVELRKDADV